MSRDDLIAEFVDFFFFFAIVSYSNKQILNELVIKSFKNCRRNSGRVELEVPIEFRGFWGMVI